MKQWRSVVALSGGVGGARLLHGLARSLPPAALSAIVNTGDDFEHWGLHISPDLDTVMYTLADMAHVERGWGLAHDSFNALDVITRYGGASWFRLGDRDLGTHLMRTEGLRRGQRLSEVTRRLCEALGVRTRVLPMSDVPCSTMLDCATEGTLPFQRWFVLKGAQPRVERVWFQGDPSPAPGVLEALEQAELVVIGPSNPYVSIDPILALDGVRRILARTPVIAVSPLVHGRALKGPLAQLIRQLDAREPDLTALEAHYDGLLNAFVHHEGDDARALGCQTFATDIVMRERADSLRLAREVLTLGAELVR